MKEWKTLIYFLESVLMGVFIFTFPILHRKLPYEQLIIAISIFDFLFVFKTIEGGIKAIRNKKAKANMGMLFNGKEAIVLGAVWIIVGLLIAGDLVNAIFSHDIPIHFKYILERLEHPEKHWS